MTYVTRSELADALDVSPQAVSKGKAVGRTVEGPDGTFDLDASIARWRSTSTGTGAENGGGQAASALGPDYHRARSVSETYRAKMARLEFEKMAGEQFERAEVLKAVFELLRMVREHLEVLPTRVEAQVGPEAAEVVRVETRRTQKDLVDAFRKAALLDDVGL